MLQCCKKTGIGFELVCALSEPCENNVEVVLCLVRGRVALFVSAVHKETPTDTTRPPISPRRILAIRSSTPNAPGRSFLFASTSKGIEASEGRASRACSSDVAVGREDCYRSAPLLARPLHLRHRRHSCLSAWRMSSDLHDGIRSCRISVPHPTKLWLSL